jgi:hypothetical protein
MPRSVASPMRMLFGAVACAAAARDNLCFTAHGKTTLRCTQPLADGAISVYMDDSEAPQSARKLYYRKNKLHVPCGSNPRRAVPAAAVALLAAAILLMSWVRNPLHSCAEKKCKRCMAPGGAWVPCSGSTTFPVTVMDANADSARSKAVAFAALLIALPVGVFVLLKPKPTAGAAAAAPNGKGAPGLAGSTVAFLLRFASAPWFPLVAAFGSTPARDARTPTHTSHTSRRSTDARPRTRRVPRGSAAPTHPHAHAAHAAHTMSQARRGQRHSDGVCRVARIAAVNMFTIVLTGPTVVIFLAAILGNRKRWYVAAVANALGATLGTATSCSHSPVHTLLLTLSCSHSPVHTLLFTPLHAAPPQMHTLLFAGTAILLLLVRERGLEYLNDTFPTVLASPAWAKATGLMQSYGVGGMLLCAPMHSRTPPNSSLDALLAGPARCMREDATRRNAKRPRLCGAARTPPRVARAARLVAPLSLCTGPG